MRAISQISPPPADIIAPAAGGGKAEQAEADEKAACSGRGYKRLEKELAMNFEDSDSGITIKVGSNINETS